MKKYFANITTAQELKKAYKRLCLQLHPDKGGDPAEFKAMQAEYEEAARSANTSTKQSKKHKPQGKRPGAFLYPANTSRLYIFEVEMFYRYNP